MRHLLRNYRELEDIGGLGMRTGIHVQLGLHATLGQFSPLDQAMKVLLRREVMPEPGPWMIVGKSTGATVATATGWAQEASHAYQYTSAKVYPDGQVSDWREPKRLDTDGSKALYSPLLPKWPLNLHAQAAIGGAFTVSWTYDPFGQGAAPASFLVFQGTTAAGIDYGTPLTDAATSLAYVAYKEGVRRYEMTTTETYADGTNHFFAVRARNSNGDQELNEYYTGQHAALVTAPTAAAIEAITQGRA